MALIDLDQANAFETAALPGQGDVDAGGGGLTTSSMTNEAALEAYGLDTYTQSERRGAVRRRPSHNPGPGNESPDAATFADGEASAGGFYGDGEGISSTFDPANGAMHLAPQLAGHPMTTPIEHPFWTIGLLIGGAFMYKAIVKNEDSENVKMSLPNFFGIGIIATLFILSEKILFGVWQLPSITPTMDFL
jgi:hypothetical protein